MMSLAELNAAAKKLADLFSTIESAAKAEQKAIDTAQKDTSRSRAWILETVAGIRKDSKLPGLMDEFRARYDELQEYRPVLTSPFLVLSKEAVLYASRDPRAEATVRALWESQEAIVRTNLRSELGVMPKPMQKIWAQEAAARRDWGRVWVAALVLGDDLPFSLGSLPLAALEAADEAYFLADVALRSAGILVDELKGKQTSSSLIALGLMTQQHDQLKAQRQAGFVFTYDEREELGLNGPSTLKPAALDIIFPDRGTGAGFKPGKPFDATAVHA